MAEMHDTTEEYLESILAIEEDGVVPMRARLVERLGLSAAAVSETVGRLSDHGYVELHGDRSLHLTDKGRSLATTVVRRHRLAERLLVDVIGLEWEKVHREADRWEHAISADVEEKLVVLLGDPGDVPARQPDPRLEARRTQAADGRARAARIPAPSPCTRISEKLELSDDGLKLVADARLMPGCSATVVERARRRRRTSTTATGEHVGADEGRRAALRLGRRSRRDRSAAGDRGDDADDGCRRRPACRGSAGSGCPRRRRTR